MVRVELTIAGNHVPDRFTIYATSPILNCFPNYITGIKVLQFAHRIYFISSMPNRLSVSSAFLRSGFLPGEILSEFLK